MAANDNNVPLEKMLLLDIEPPSVLTPTPSKPAATPVNPRDMQSLPLHMRGDTFREQTTQLTRQLRQSQPNPAQWAEDIDTAYRAIDGSRHISATEIERYVATLFNLRNLDETCIPPSTTTRLTKLFMDNFAAHSDAALQGLVGIAAAAVNSPRHFEKFMDTLLAHATMECRVSVRMHVMLDPAPADIRDGTDTRHDRLRASIEPVI